MSRVTRREWYRRVNDCWPPEVPELTADEAVRAAKKLYRFVRKRSFRGEVRLTSGNRYTAIRRGVLYINPNDGWRSFVHLLSHALHWGPHSGEHARLERRMIRVVIDRGWLHGKLKSQPKLVQVQDPRVEREARARQGLQRWERKLKLATTKVRQYRRRVKWYDQHKESICLAASA